MRRPKTHGGLKYSLYQHHTTNAVTNPDLPSNSGVIADLRAATSHGKYTAYVS